MFLGKGVFLVMMQAGSPMATKAKGVLFKHTKPGCCHMPAKGACMGFKDEEGTLVIQYILGQGLPSKDYRLW